MGRPAILSDEKARVALQEAADSLFYERGTVAVSMGEIRDLSGVSLRRLYSLCPSKADLISMWLRQRHQVWLSGFTSAVDARLVDGAAPIDAIFDALTDWMTSTEFRGCGFINTHAEVSELTVEHQEIIRDHKRAVSQYLATLVSDGDAIAVLLDGAIVQASMFCDTEPIEHARRAALAFDRSIA